MHVSLAALDAEMAAATRSEHSGARAVVTADRDAIMLAAHQDASVTVAATDAARAIEVAGQLIWAALPRLPRGS